MIRHGRGDHSGGVGGDPRLHLAEGMPIKAIVRKLGSGQEHGSQRGAFGAAVAVCAGWVGSIVDAVEPQIRVLLKEFPEMPATVIAEWIGWDRSMTVVSVSLPDHVTKRGGSCTCQLGPAPVVSSERASAGHRPATPLLRHSLPGCGVSRPTPRRGL